jgi:hypothetical protein
MVFDSWLFIDPELQSAAPTSSGFRAINAELASSYVQSVDVYREYTDNTSVSAQFYWNPSPGNGLVFTNSCCTSCGGIGCAACQQTIQNGCLSIRDVEAGIVIPVPATYSETNERFEVAAFTDCHEPDQVKIWYRAGDLDNAYVRGTGLDPLSHSMAQVIAWHATALLERPFCSCANVGSVAEHLRTDIAYTGNDTSYIVNFETLDNPLGTKIGSLMAWRRISQMRERFIDAGII